MTIRLDGKTILLTGAALGLGRVMALALAEAGANVGALDLPAHDAALAAMKEIVEARGLSGRLLPLIADVTREDQVRDAEAQLEKAYGAPHGLVNNAAIGMQDIHPDEGRGRGKFYELDVARWCATIDVNVTGPFIVARSIAAKFVALGRGKIVNVTTTIRTMQAPGFCPYGPSKAALEAASAIWAKDLESTGVAVNVLFPGGAADTRMISPGEAPDRTKLVAPAKMIAPIIWLMSDESDGVTGKRFDAVQWDRGPEEASAPIGFPY